MPYLPCAAAGASHQIEAVIDVIAARHANDQAARHGTAPMNGSYRRRSAGPSSTNATTATLTPGPLAVSTRASAAGIRQLRGWRTPRQVKRISHGSAAYASSVTVVR